MELGDVNNLQDCVNYLEGHLNDYTEGVIDKEEYMKILYDYTMFCLSHKFVEFP